MAGHLLNLANSTDASSGVGGVRGLPLPWWRCHCRLGDHRMDSEPAGDRRMLWRTELLLSLSSCGGSTRGVAAAAVRLVVLPPGGEVPCRRSRQVFRLLAVRRLRVSDLRRWRKLLLKRLRWPVNGPDLGFSAASEGKKSDPQLQPVEDGETPSRTRDPEPYAVDQLPPRPDRWPPCFRPLRQQRLQHRPLHVREISPPHEP